MLLFAVSVSALLFFTYWNTRRTLDAQTDQIIEAEITGLTEQYQRHGGLRGLAESVMGRSLHRQPGALSSRRRRASIIAGNLDSGRRSGPMPGDFVEFDYERRVNGESETRRARGRLFTLAGDFSCWWPRTCMTAT